MPKHVLKDSSLLSLSDHQSLNEMAWTVPGVLLQLSLFSFVSAGLGLPCRACDWLPQCPQSTEVGLSARAAHRINPWVPPMACLGIASGGVLK